MGAASAAAQSTAMPQSSQGKGGGAPMGGSGAPISGGKGISQNMQLPQGGPQLPNTGQQGWQYEQGASGNRVTYPSTSGQQQFGQPMQQSAAPYSNTIGEGQQSNQMQSSGKGKGA